MIERRKKTTRLTVSLDEVDYAALNALASKSDVSLSWVIRQAIQRFVREHGAQPELPLTLAGRGGQEGGIELRIPMLDGSPHFCRSVETGSLCPAIPGPWEGERPTAYADRVGEWYADQATDRQRKVHGLFLTPIQAADFMGGRIGATGPRVRILDPAAGAGILCCAAVEALVSRQPKPDAIELVAYEVDGDLITPLRAVLDHLAGWCRDRDGATVHVRIEAADFILANAGAVGPYGLFSSHSQAEEFDAVIANPPYFKIGKSDPRAAAVPGRGSRTAEHLLALHGSWRRATSRGWGLCFHYAAKLHLRTVFPPFSGRVLRHDSAN